MADLVAGGRGPALAALVLGALLLAGPIRANGPLRQAVGATHATRQQAAGPTATISVSGDALVNTPFTFDASQSKGTGLQYVWSFGDGTQQVSGAKVQHTYTSVVDVTISLTVKDGSGATNTATQALRVVPSLGTFTGLPVLGQITPASSFPADLSLDVTGLKAFSASVNGALLSSDSFSYDGSAGHVLIELPAVQVVNEDDPGVAGIMDESVGGVPLINNVGVTISYTLASGASESEGYTTSLIQPPGGAASLLPTPSPTPVVSATPSATRSATPAPSSAAPVATAPPAPGNPDTATPDPPAPQARYLQATPPTQTPVPIGTAAPASPAAAASPTPAASATAGASAPAAQGPYAWSITYPTYLPVVGRPVNEDDVNDYYLKGDPQFHHPDDPLVRRYAIKIARAGGTFPNDPKLAADNIYHYVYGLLGIGDPGNFETDQQILQQVVSGDLVPGSRSVQFICIAHAYFVSSLTRTLGLPTREETIGFGRGTTQNDDGSWQLKYYQEGANQVWYGGAWHHYDTWIGTRDRDDYLSTSLTEAAWYAFSPQSTPFLDANGNPTGLAGHDFSIVLSDGTPGSPDQWRFIEQHTRPGISLADPVPASYMDVNAPHAPRGPVTQPVILPATSTPAP